jgi:putative inorganic carbon (hco3(-)) transporter
VASVAITIEKRGGKTNSGRMAYSALLIFSILYYVRPEDIIPGLNSIPLSKISGGIALLALISGLAGNKIKTKFPLELKLLLVLFAHLVITIPFAFWRGGAFATVFEKFSKEVIVALLVTLIVQNIDELRKLILVQAAAVGIMTIVSVIIHPGGVRLQGALGGIFDNPNDLAINIAINWPLCLTFFFFTRGIGKKLFWLVCLLGMLYAVVETYSRSGLMAMIVSVLVCLWEFGIRGKRFPMIIMAGVIGIVGVGIAISTPNYVARVESLVLGNIEGSGDKGSLEARRELLKESVRLSFQHPLFGVGPGNFPAATESWRVTHNTYTELSAEGGFPALILFVVILGLAFRNVRRVRKTDQYGASKEIQFFTSAMWAGLAAYVVGAAFASTEYELFPYFMVAYTSVLYRLASKPIQEAEGRPGRQRDQIGRRELRDEARKPEFA